MMNDREFEESLKGIFEESFEENSSSSQIDIEKLLESAYKDAEIEKKKNEKAVKKKRRIKRFKAAVIFIAIVTASLAVFGSEQGYADIFRFMADKVGVSGDVVQDNLIGDEAEEATNFFVELDELDSKVGFHIEIPEYLEENYEMIEEAQIVELNENTMSVILEYYDIETREIVLYKIISVKDKKSNSSLMDIPEAEAEVIKKTDSTEYFYYRDEESMRGRVYWQSNEYLYYIDGNIDREEAVNIVESLK